MVAERLLGDTDLALVDTPDAIASTARMLGWNFATSATDKVVTNIYVRMNAAGTFVAGTKAQIWKRETPTVDSTLEVNIEIGSGIVTGASGSEQTVPGVGALEFALIQNDFYFVTIYHPSTQTGNYWFESGFGDPTNGSLSGNCIFENGQAVTFPPTDETFTDGAFGLDVEIDDVSSDQIVVLSIISDTSSALAMTFARADELSLISETDSTLTLSFARSKELSLVSETDSVLVPSFARSKDLSLISETDTPLEMAFPSSDDLSLIEETDSALTMTFARAKELSIVSETDSAFGMTFAKAVTLGLATETDSVLAITYGRAMELSIVNTTDIALPMTFSGGVIDEPTEGGWIPRVNAHCVYLQQKTVNGNATYIKRRPCIITDFALDGNPILRVRHTGEVYGDATNGVPRRTDPDSNLPDMYVSY